MSSILHTLFIGYAITLPWQEGHLNPLHPYIKTPFSIGCIGRHTLKIFICRLVQLIHFKHVNPFVSCFELKMDTLL